MRAAVLEASALAAVLFAEPGADLIVEEIEGRELYAPDLIRYEIANVCLSKIKQNPGTRVAILKQFASWERMGVRLYAVSSNLLVSTAIQSKLTACDAAYLSMAQILKADIITLDSQLRAAWPL